ncbi:unnamed protein product, partial [Candidula unifasciata]
MDDLTVEAVLEFILSHGGRVLNSKLVSQFKDYLNHPVNKVSNREKFKGFVNELAVLKTENGEKVLVLKKKYSQGLDRFSDFHGITTKPGADSPDGGTMSKARADENVTVALRRGDRVPASPKMSEDSSSMDQQHFHDNSQKSVSSSTFGVASMDEDANTSIDSVKDKIKLLNKNISESDLNRLKSGGGNKKTHKHAGGDDENSHDYYMNVSKTWLMVCATSNYHDMNRLLSKNPGLAKLKICYINTYNYVDFTY